MPCRNFFWVCVSGSRGNLTATCLAALMLTGASLTGSAAEDTATPVIFPQLGHSLPVVAIAFSPDGSKVASGSHNESLRLWDVQSGREIRRFEGHNAGILSVTFSPDGKHIVSGSDDKTLRLWDAATGREIRRIEGHASEVKSVAFAADGKSIVSGSADRTLRLWDAESGREMRRFEGHASAVNAVAISSDGKHIVSGSDDKTLRLWDATTGREIRRFEGHSGGITAVAFSPDGRTFASGSDTVDDSLRLWDVASGSEVRRFKWERARGSLKSVAFSPDGRQVVAGTSENTWWLWEVATGRELSRFAGFAWHKSLAVSPDGRNVVTSGDKTLRLWDTASGAEIRTFDSGHTAPITAVAFSPDGMIVASGSDDRTVRLWDVATGREIRRLMGYTSTIVLVTFASDGKSVISDGGDGMWFWDVASGREIRRFTGARFATSVAFSPDGTIVASGDVNGTVLWDVASGRAIRRFGAEAGVAASDTTSLAFSPDGRSVVSGGENGTLRLWDVATGREIRRFAGHTDEIVSVLFSPDGRRLVSGSSDKTLRVWDVATGREIRQDVGLAIFVQPVAFTPDAASVVVNIGTSFGLWNVENGRLLRSLNVVAPSASSAPVAFTPDGTAILTAGSDGLISRDYALRLWDVASGRVIRRFEGRSARALAASFVPHGKQLIVGGGNGALQLWDLESGREIHRFEGHTNSVWSLAMFPDGKTFISAGDDGTLRLWDVQSGREIRRFEMPKDPAFEIMSVVISPDGKTVASSGSGRAPALRLWDVASGRLTRRLEGHTGGTLSLAFSPDGRHLVSSSDDKTLRVWDVASGREIRRIANEGGRFMALSPDGTSCIVFGDGNWTMRLRDLTSGHDIHRFEGNVNSLATFSPDGRTVLARNTERQLSLWDVSSGRVLRKFEGNVDSAGLPAFSADGQKALYADDDGTVRIWNVVTGKELAALVGFSDGEWLAMTPDGYFHGSDKAADYLNVRLGNQVVAIDRYREQFFRPDLVRQSLAGVALTGVRSLASVKPAPRVEIVSTAPFASSEEFVLRLRLTDAGGGIGDVRVYVNGTAVAVDTRGLAVAAASLRDFTVRLVNGQNDIKAVAFNADNSMLSTEAVHRVTAQFTVTRRPRLIALVAGIQEFDNPRLNLRHAIADAKLFGGLISTRSERLFGGAAVTYMMTAGQTNKASLQAAFAQLRQEVGPDDVFVFYVASHGIVDDGEYFLLTSNVGPTSTERLRKDALSQRELGELIGNIPAHKKLIVLDTCQSGQLGDALQVALLTRGMSEEAAVKLLSRAVGSVILAAAMSTQDAIEGYNGHGVFTYVLAEGLRGAADRNKDGYITVNELTDYLEEQVPDLAQKAFRRKQFPYVSRSGNNFPFARVD